MTTYEADRNGVLGTKLFSTTVENTTVETSIVGTLEGSAILPAKFLRDGRTIRLTARGVITTKAAPSGDINFDVRIGGIAGTVVLSTGAQAPGDGLVNRGWVVEGIITCRSTGTTGTVFAQGYRAIYSSATTTAIVEMKNTGTQTIDTTVAQQIVLTVRWVTADASNSLTCTNLLIESLN